MHSTKISPPFLIKTLLEDRLYRIKFLGSLFLLSKRVMRKGPQEEEIRMVGSPRKMPVEPRSRQMYPCEYQHAICSHDIKKKQGQRVEYLAEAPCKKGGF